MTRGRLPPDPRPLFCMGCSGLPRFVDNVAVACVCGSPPHPRAHLNLIPMNVRLTREQLRGL